MNRDLTPEEMEELDCLFLNEECKDCPFHSNLGKCYNCNLETV